MKQSRECREKDTDCLQGAATPVYLHPILESIIEKEQINQ